MSEEIRRIIENRPPIERLEISLYEDWYRDPAAVIPPGVELPEVYIYLSFELYPRQLHHWVDALHYSNFETWRRMGRALGGNETLRHLALSRSTALQTLQTWGEFFNGLKENKSIESLTFYARDISMFDLDHFVRNNKNLKYLHLTSSYGLTPDHCVMLSTAIGNSTLRRLVLPHGNFVSDEPFNQIVSACLRVETLVVSCWSTSQLSSLCSLLRDRRAMLRKVSVQISSGLSNEISRIAASLMDNNTLKVLEFRDKVDLNPFGPLLCDPSSLNSICNSNHTLEDICFDSYGWHSSLLPQPIEALLELNKNVDKIFVVREKIREYYFDGTFNVAPFVNMPISILPLVLSAIRGGEINRQNAIFRILRSMPMACARKTQRQSKKQKL